MSQPLSDVTCGNAMRDDAPIAGTRGPCAERGFLEFHHMTPFAEGGEATVANLQLRCRAHNQYEADVRSTQSSWTKRARPSTSHLADAFARSSGTRLGSEPVSKILPYVRELITRRDLWVVGQF